MRLAPSLQATDPNLGWWVLNVSLVHFLSGSYFFPNNNFSFSSAQNMCAPQLPHQRGMDT
jgi:hypothetical protein